MTGQTLKRYFNLEGADFSDISVNALDLSVRASNCLSQSGIKTVEELLNRTPEYLYSIKNMGKASVNEIISKLGDFVAKNTNNPAEASSDFNGYLESIPADALDLSERAKNCLAGAHIENLKQLSEMTEKDLHKIPNLGAKSADEIIRKRNAYIGKITQMRENIKLNYPRLMDGDFKAHIDEVILNPDYSPDNLTEGQRELFGNIKAARRVLGADLSLEAYTNAEKYASVRDALAELGNDSALYSQRRLEIEKALEGMAGYMPEKRLKPFVTAYCLDKNIKNSNYNIEAIDAAKVKNFIFLFDDEYRRTDDKENLSEGALKFAVWLNYNIYDGANEFAAKTDFYERGPKPLNIQILKLRISGLSLAEIGKKYDVTRERIRQRELKTLKHAANAYVHLSHDLILFIYALEDGSGVLTRSVVKKYLGDPADVIFYILKAKNVMFAVPYEYHKDLDAAVVGAAENISEQRTFLSDAVKELDEFDASLPRFVKENKLKSLIFEYCKSHNINKEFALNYIAGKRKKFGVMMCGKKPYKKEIFEYILKRYFPEGYKIEDEASREKLLKYTRRLFGFDFSGDSGHSTDSTVQRAGVLNDKGLYIYRDYDRREAWAIEAVNDYIARSPRSLFTYNELFYKLKHLFKGTDINNSHVLHGALKQYGTPYITSKSYISKKRGHTFLDELEEFAKSKVFFTKREILKYFSGTSEAQILQTIDRSDLIFGTGLAKYVYAPAAFGITEEDREQIGGYLELAVSFSPVAAGTAMEELSAAYPEFFSRNKITDKGTLFAALQYMFKDRFKFSRPFISKKE